MNRVVIIIILVAQVWDCRDLPALAHAAAFRNSSDIKQTGFKKSGAGKFIFWHFGNQDLKSATEHVSNVNERFYQNLIHQRINKTFIRKNNNSITASRFSELFKQNWLLFQLALFVILGLTFLLSIFSHLVPGRKSRATEQPPKKSTEEISHSNNAEIKFQTLMDSSLDLIFTLDNIGNLTGANQQLYQKFNLQTKDVIGKNKFAFLPVKVANQMQNKLHEALNGHEQKFRWSMSVNGTAPLDMETTLIPLQDQQSKIEGVIGITRELTPKRQFKQTLPGANTFQVEHDRLETILEAMQDMVMILSDDLKVMYLNRTFKQTFPKIKIGESCLELIDLLNAYQKKSRAMRKCHTSAPCIWEHWDDRHQIWLTASACPILLPEGLCQLFILRDITQTRKIEQERLNAERLAAVTHTVIAYNHEINNPLFGIIGYLEIMMQNEKNPERLEELNLIFDAANRIAEVTRRLRNLTTPAIREYVGSAKMLDLTASNQGEE